MKGHRPIFPMAALALLVLALFMPAAAGAADPGDQGPVISLEADGEPLYDVLLRLSRETGYSLTIPEYWSQAPVTVKIKDKPLEVGLKKIIQAAGYQNHALIINQARKSIEIYIPEGNWPDTGSVSASEYSGSESQPVFQRDEPDEPPPPPPASMFQGRRLGMDEDAGETPPPPDEDVTPDDNSDEPVEQEAAPEPPSDDVLEIMYKNETEQP